MTTQELLNKIRYYIREISERDLFNDIKPVLIDLELLGKDRPELSHIAEHCGFLLRHISLDNEKYKEIALSKDVLLNQLWTLKRQLEDRYEKEEETYKQSILGKIVRIIQWTEEKDLKQEHEAKKWLMNVREVATNYNDEALCKTCDYLFNNTFELVANQKVEEICKQLRSQLAI